MHERLEYRVQAGPVSLLVTNWHAVQASVEHKFLLRMTDCSKLQTISNTHKEFEKKLLSIALYKNNQQ